MVILKLIFGFTLFFHFSSWSYSPLYQDYCYSPVEIAALQGRRFCGSGSSKSLKVKIEATETQIEKTEGLKGRSFR